MSAQATQHQNCQNYNLQFARMTMNEHLNDLQGGRCKITLNTYVVSKPIWIPMEIRNTFFIFCAVASSFHVFMPSRVYWVHSGSSLSALSSAIARSKIWSLWSLWSFKTRGKNFEFIFKTKSHIFLRLIFYIDWFLGFLKFPPLQRIPIRATFTPKIKTRPSIFSWKIF